MSKLIWEIDLISTSETEKDGFHHFFFEGIVDDLIPHVNKLISEIFTNHPNVNRVNGCADAVNGSQSIISKFFNMTREKWKSKE